MEEKELYGIISRNLKQERLKRKMSQEQFAITLGISFYTYQRIEAPNTLQTMSIALLLSIANKLDIDLVDLIK